MALYYHDKPIRAVDPFPENGGDQRDYAPASWQERQDQKKQMSSDSQIVKLFKALLG